MDFEVTILYYGNSVISDIVGVLISFFLLPIPHTNSVVLQCILKAINFIGNQCSILATCAQHACTNSIIPFM